MADKYVTDFNKDPFLKEEDLLMSYHCPFHDGWHVGHVEEKTLPSHISVHRLLDKIKKDKNDRN